jgi:hypothetical protein
VTHGNAAIIMVVFELAELAEPAYRHTREVARSMPWETRWVHGNAIVAETLHPTLEQVTSETGTALTNTEIVGRRRGWGVTYQGVNQEGTFNWFHAMIPTPTVVDGRPRRLERVFVLYDTPGTGGNPVFVRKIHVWDGPDFIQEFDLGGAGNKSHIRRPFVIGESQFEIEEDKKQEVLYGIGISIQVEFGVGPATSGGEPTTILFTSAGAEFSWAYSPVRRWVSGIFDRIFGR